MSDTEENMPPALETVSENRRGSTCDLRIKDSESSIPGRLLFRNEEIIRGRGLVDISMLHTNNIKNITLDDILKGHILSSLNDKPKKSMANVGVDRVGKRGINWRSKVDLLKKILSSTRSSLRKTRAVRFLAFRDLRKTEGLPWVGTEDCKILGHFSQLDMEVEGEKATYYQRQHLKDDSRVIQR